MFLFTYYSKLLRKIIYIIFYTIFNLTSNAQSFSLDVNQTFEDFNTDLDYLIPNKESFDRTDWLILSGSSLVLGSAFIFDNQIKNSSQANQSNLKGNTSKYIGEPFGNPVYQGLGLIGVYGVSKIIKNNDLKEATTIAFRGAVWTSLSVVSMKLIFSRGRPYSINSDEWFVGSIGESQNRSFPSGHSALAFSLASSYSHYYKKPWLSVSLYGLAGITAWSRVYDNEHWASDVVAGAIIGHFIGKWTCKNSKIRILSSVNEQGVGLYGFSIPLDSPGEF